MRRDAPAAGPLAGPALFCLFVLALLPAYYPALGHPPRADQYAAIYHMQGYAGLLERLTGMISWARTHLRGDPHAFRPLANVFLVLQWSLLGYQFWLYQLLGILLQAALATQIAFAAHRRLGTALPLAAALAFWFACFPLAADAVVWHHMNYMLVFGLVLVAGLQRWWAMEAQAQLRPAPFVLFLLAALLQDQGAFLGALAGYCLVMAAVERSLREDHPRAGFYLMCAAVCLALFALIWGLNWLDFRLSGARAQSPLAFLANGAATAGEIAATAVAYLGKTLEFWLRPFFLPADYVYQIHGRMWVVPFPRPDWLRILNAAVLAAGAAALLIRLWRGRRDGLALQRRTIFLLAALALTWATLFVAGRAMQRGLDRALDSGASTSLPFLLFVSLLLAALFGGETAASRLRRRAGLAVAVAGAAALAIAIGQGWLLHQVNRTSRLALAGDVRVIDAVLHAAGRVAPRERPQFRFQFREPCPTNARLPQIGPDATIASALFPLWYRPGASAALLDCPLPSPGTPVEFAGPEGTRWLFDGSTARHSYLETAAWPIVVDLRLAGPRPIRGYALATYFSPDRMPRAWRVYAADAAGAWQPVDSRTGATGWTLRETRAFPLATPVTTARLRFEFLGGNAPVMRLYEIRIDAEPAAAPR